MVLLKALMAVLRKVVGGHPVAVCVRMRVAARAGGGRGGGRAFLRSRASTCFPVRPAADEDYDAAVGEDGQNMNELYDQFWDDAEVGWPCHLMAYSCTVCERLSVFCVRG